MILLQIADTADFALINYIGVLHLIILFLILGKYIHYRKHFPVFHFDFFIRFGREEIQLSDSTAEKKSKSFQNRMTNTILVLLALDLFLFLLKSIVPN